MKFEHSNIVQEDMYLIFVEDDGTEPSKWQQVGNDAHVYYLGKKNILHYIYLEINVKELDIIHANSSNIALCSKMSGLGVDEKDLKNPLKSKFISKIAMKKYLNREEILCKKIQHTFLEDHEWTLGS